MYKICYNLKIYISNFYYYHLLKNLPLFYFLLFILYLTLSLYFPADPIIIKKKKKKRFCYLFIFNIALE